MARRSVTGQLNMFDFWSNLDPKENGAEVQMVSLIPDEEVSETDKNVFEASTENASTEELVETAPVVAGERELELNPTETIDDRQTTHPEKKDAPVMHKEIRDKEGNVIAEISYFNYNKIYIKRENEEAKWLLFDNSKEAVDCYIEEMLKLEGENHVNH